MTRSPNMLQRLTVEVLLTPEDAPGFRLNRSRLGTGRLAAAGSPAEWVPILGDALEVHMTRGGERDGVAFSASVGTLTITALDSPGLERVRPSTPIRVRRLRDPIHGYGVRPYGTEPYGGPADNDRPDLLLYTGTVLDIRTAWERVGDDLSNIRAVTTLTAVDAVQQLANTARYGAVISQDYAWANFETLGQRAARLLDSGAVPWEGPANTPTDWVAINFDRWDTNGFAFGLLADENGPGIFGFRWLPGESYRAMFISAALPAPEELPATVSAGLWIQLENPGPSTPRGVRVQLRAGTTVLATTETTLPASGQWGHVEVSGTVTTTDPLTVHVTSLGTGSAPDLNRGLAVTGLTVSTGATSCQGAAYPLGSLVYESTVANHLDVAVNSTRGAWWVDARGVVQVRGCRHGANASILQLSDEPGAPLSYVGLSHAFDTAGLVNELTLENHGRQRDPENPARFVADDRNLGPYRDWTSVADFGLRSAEVSTGLAYPDQRAPMFLDAAERLAREYLAVAADAEPQPFQVRLYRDPDDPPLPNFDVMHPVNLRFRGQTYRCTIAGLEHEITPHRWHTTLTLIERT